MEIRQYLELIKRWAWLIILGAIIVGGTTYVISRRTTPVYSTTLRMIISQAPGSSGNSAYADLLTEQKLAQTYVTIFTARPVLEATISQLNLPFDANTLGSMVSVSAPPDTQILIVNVEDTNPERAAAIANTIGQVFIEKNQERESLRYAKPIADWKERLQTLRGDRETLEVSINELGSPESPEGQAQLSRLEAQLKEIEVRYTDVFNQLNALELDQARESSNLVPIEKAEAPSVPIRPRTVRNTALATITGGLLALGIILLIEYLDDTVKTQEQVLADTGLSTIGAIANIKGANHGSNGLITQTQPRDPVSEAYRVLRTNIGFSAVDGEVRSILVSSSSPSEGKSTTAANLAIVMAQTGKNVIIVDADLRRPVQHKLFSSANNQGLTTAILDSQTPVSNHLQRTQIRNLRVMASGPIPPNPAELLNSQRMTQIISELENEADFVIFDTPPVLTVTDAAILASQVDGSILVLYTGQTRRQAFTEAAERLSKAGGNIFGAILNRLNPENSGYYYHEYYNTYEQADARESGKSSRFPNWVAGLIKR